jgi:hypothetical protein
MTAVEWLKIQIINTTKRMGLELNIDVYFEEALKMELEQKEKVNLLLNTLLHNNMCSVAGDELIKQFKKKQDERKNSSRMVRR